MADYHFLILSVFITGYLALIFEHPLRINKAAIALITGIFCWGIYLNLDPEPTDVKLAHLGEHLSDITQILFFLIGAMTIVELISSHQGFKPLKRAISISSPRKLYWVLLWLGFWLSSVLDNLTAILVLVSLMRQVIPDLHLRRLFSAGLVFAVNVGGAWTPIGDVTTTMLWIEGRVNTFPLMANLFLPSVISLAVFGFLFSFTIPKSTIQKVSEEGEPKIPGARLVLGFGILGLILVPVLKVLFHLPPFAGMMACLGVIWAVTDRYHKKQEDRKVLKVDYILTKIDISCVLFFFGILLAVDSLQTAGILEWLQQQTSAYFSNRYFFAFWIGIFSAVIDNVPLVAGLINMFDLSEVPSDNIFWHLIAYCAGVGGSLLIIGSAPGVALMSLKDIQFFWYVKKVSWIALISFIAGWAAIALVNQFSGVLYGQ